MRKYAENRPDQAIVQQPVAQLPEENFYISENELKVLAQNAVDVIDIRDNVHKSNIIKSAQSTGKN